MTQISGSSMQRLALAKEMYIIGLYHEQKNTRSERMQAILAFDFSVTTIIVTYCIDNNQNPKQKNGRAKKWDELISTFETFYAKPPVIADLNNLHDLRNSIQHGDVQPSDSDILRHKKVVRDLFDDICLNVYRGVIKFDSISMAKVLKSPHETELLFKAELYIEEGKYELDLYFIHTAALYHYMLIKTNLFLPILPTYDYLALQKGNPIVEQIYRSLDNATDRLAMGEFYLREKDLLKKAPPFLEDFEKGKRFTYLWISQLKPLQGISYDEVEKARTSIYNIILGTENVITEKLIVDVPVIYGSHVTDITQTSAKVNYGILCKLEIEKCILKLHSDSKMTMLVQSYQILKESGYHDFVVDKLAPGKLYYCIIEATQIGDQEYHQVPLCHD